MGGNAFARGANPLHTPRMPPAVYEHVLRACHAALRKLFDVVGTPVPGPGKEDHGDIDIFVAGAKPGTSAPASVRASAPAAAAPDASLEVAARRLGAVRTFKQQPGLLICAVPWPDDVRSGGAAEGARSEPSDAGAAAAAAAAPRFVQVDLHQCGSAEEAQRMLFRQAHGDLWNILGSVVRPVGLTIGQDGLSVRIPEIEPRGKRRARVLLTDAPADILAFLGLDPAAAPWDAPFASVDALFAYAATCRFFWVWPAPDATAADPPDKEDDDDGAAEPDPDPAAAAADAKLTSSERRRVHNRPIFRRWYEDFIPACRAAGRFTTPRAGDRASVCAEALARFPAARAPYEARLLEWRREEQRLSLARDVIKSAIPAAADDADADAPKLADPMWRRRTAAALRKIVVLDDYALGVRPAETLRRPADGLYDEDAVRRFVRDNWRRVGAAACRADRERFEQKKKEKEKERGE
ncbi:hypothetical protein GGS23DRAFT_603784 [Durotheca rogersii]|uniref:uncharacterized protein n=1 Tax=Durotheca rogersii TaxID=419775 RepID=UPI00221E6D98|nr:uncharacterized protein GGS23DRAFT_603784 [Durotheca rogersii]KAI5865132.1 hypothetical protein GGS23DRAFT_603784 [Durotheca rogersii]